MVNSIGMLTRKLEAYTSAQKQSPDRLKHATTNTLKEVDEWRFCEMNIFAEIIKGNLIDKGLQDSSGDLDQNINDLTKGLVRCKYSLKSGLFSKPLDDKLFDDTLNSKEILI